MTDKTRDELVKEAERLGLEVHHRQNAETIQNNINAFYAEQFKKQEDEVIEAEEEEAAVVKGPVIPSGKIQAKTKEQWIQEDFNERKRQAAALVRCRITCMNPAKREWSGEIFSVGSAKMGTLKKYVPYGVEWHVPRAMLEEIKLKKCSFFRNVPDGRGGTKREAFQGAEYAVEELPALTPEQLEELRRKQAMREGTAA